MKSKEILRAARWWYSLAWQGDPARVLRLGKMPTPRRPRYVTSTASLFTMATLAYPLETERSLAYGISMKNTRPVFTLLTLLIFLISARRPLAGQCIGKELDKPVRNVCGIVLGGPPEPLEGALVTVYEGDAQVAFVRTGKDGRFSLSGLKGGQYRMLVEFPGFQPAVSPLVVRKPTKKCKHSLRVILALGSIDACSQIWTDSEWRQWQRDND